MGFDERIPLPEFDDPGDKKEDGGHYEAAGAETAAGEAKRDPRPERLKVQSCRSAVN